jgi:hypothetical protein
LNNGTEYLCTVTAFNEMGSSDPSNGKLVTPTASGAPVNGDYNNEVSSGPSVPTASVPAAPTLDSYVLGHRSVELSFTANSNGGSPITSYTASCNISTVGGVGTIEFGGTRGERLLAISRYPGDFQVSEDCKQVQHLSGYLPWRTEGASEQGEACDLEANTTYYWNITFTDGVNMGSSTCGGTPCQTYIRVANPNYVN